LSGKARRRKRKPGVEHWRSKSLERRALEVVVMEVYLKTVESPDAEKIMEELERMKIDIYREYIARRRARREKRGVMGAER